MNPFLLMFILLSVFIIIVVIIKKVIDKIFLTQSKKLDINERIKSLKLIAYALLPLGIAGVGYLLYQDVNSFQREHFGIFVELLSFANTLIWFIPAILFVIAVTTLDKIGYSSKVLNIVKILFFTSLAIHAVLFLSIAFI